VAGLYVHVPFCAARCRYCAFPSSVYEPRRADRYLTALEHEAGAAAADLARLRPDTVYLGGGTPTALSLPQLRRLCGIVRGAAAPGEVSELTVEANPCSADARRLALLREFGFGRISIGAQSFDDEELELLGRVHRADAIGAAVKTARHAGFASLSLDLIFGLPGQRAAGFLATLERALELAPDHLSLYGLTWEEGTPLGEELKAGLAAPCPEEEERAMYERAVGRLTAAGYRHYEIASFARAGHECRHNINYWTGGEYLGLGAGACSCLEGVRRGNCRSVDDYIARAEREGGAVAERECLPPEKRAREALMLGLRLRDGVELVEFRARTGFDAVTLFGDAFREHVEAGRLELADGRLRLTLDGVLVANSVMADFI
jgi:oxygen-independent coproporphyrinogen-3 oxidase